MLVKDFDYHLPPEQIAQTPLEPRDHSRLLVLAKDSDTIEHRHFYDICDYLVAGDLLVFNDTRVMPARLLGQKSSGAKIEVFLLHRQAGDDWEVLVRPGKKARVGTVVEFGEGLSCEFVEDTDFGGRIARFCYEGVFEEKLARLGEVPLPPYIHEKLADPERYQTVYAREQGSAAAPTAGLHFTPELLEKIKAKGVGLAFVTLHVGLGTFRPVSVENIKDHAMHSEYYSVSQQTAEMINKTKEQGGRVIAVGTTPVRVLESSGQGGKVQPTSGKTDIFIYPGYQFKIIDGLITNFHLPQSTLLMLVSAFYGRERIMQAYQTAIAEGYRFFSFGDGMFIG